MVFLILFLELLILFFLSRFVTQDLFLLFYRLTKSKTITMYLLAILFFPGVFLHEMAHFVTAKLLFVPTGSIEFWPKIVNSRIKLGSVEVAKKDPLRRATIGCAPFIWGSGILLLLLFNFTFLSSFLASPWSYLVFLYSAFVIANTMFSSKKDAEGTLEAGITIGVIVSLLVLLRVRVPEFVGDFFTARETRSFVEQIIWLMGIPVGINIGIVLFAKFLFKQ